MEIEEGKYLKPVPRVERVRYAHADIAELHRAVATLVTKTDTKTDTPQIVAFRAAEAV